MPKQKKKTHHMFNLKPFPLALIAAMTTGILLHDFHLDKVATIASAMPVQTNQARMMSSDKLSVEKIPITVEKVITPNYHTHVERVSLPKMSAFRSTLPNMHPSRDDDRRYVQNRKLLLMSGGDALSLWPSV